MESHPVKNRKGYKSIVVDDKKYQYALSFKSMRGISDEIYLFDENDKKIVVKLSDVKFPPNFERSTWRGKHGDKGYGKKEVAHIIMGVRHDFD